MERVGDIDGRREAVPCNTHARATTGWFTSGIRIPCHFELPRPFPTDAANGTALVLPSSALAALPARHDDERRRAASGLADTTVALICSPDRPVSGLALYRDRFPSPMTGNGIRRSYRTVQIVDG